MPQCSSCFVWTGGKQSGAQMTFTTSEPPAKCDSAPPYVPVWAADSTLVEIVRRILASGNPQRILIFGSRARGDAQVDSDYDLLVVESSDLPRHKRAVVYRRALAGLAGAKDILVWTPEEIAKWSGVPNAFITATLQEGIVLYERPE